MNINYILLFIICHVIGDYYLQNQYMAEKKKVSLRWVIIHSGAYCVPFVSSLLFFEKSKPLFFLVFLLVLGHFIFDIIKYLLYILYKKLKNKTCKWKVILSWIKEWMVYTLDQVLHITLIVVICYGFKEKVFYVYPLIKNIFLILNLDSIIILRWTLIILCIYKPANITFKILFSWCKPMIDINSEENFNNKDEVENMEASPVDKEDRPIENVGAIIGFLERVIIVLFLVANQYSAIGFVLTAKSIARYNLISKSQSFAEYYLVGTLYSVLFSVVLYNVIF